MKFILTVVAALFAVGGAPADAAPQERTVVRERTTVAPAAQSTRTIVRERTTVRRDYGYRRQPRRVCTVRYRHGERIRTCRTRYGRY